MVVRQYAFDYLHFELAAYLPGDFPNAQAHILRQYLITVFRDPDDVITRMIGGMAAGRIAHGYTSKKEVSTCGRLFFGSITMSNKERTKVHQYRLKPVDLYQGLEN